MNNYKCVTLLLNRRNGTLQQVPMFEEKASGCSDCKKAGGLEKPFLPLTYTNESLLPLESLNLLSLPASFPPAPLSTKSEEIKQFQPFILRFLYNWQLFDPIFSSKGGHKPIWTKLRVLHSVTTVCHLYNCCADTSRRILRAPTNNKGHFEAFTNKDTATHQLLLSKPINAAD